MEMAASACRRFGAAMAAVLSTVATIAAQTSPSLIQSTAIDWAQQYTSRYVIVRTDRGKVSGHLVSAAGVDLVVDVLNPEPWATPRATRVILKMPEVRDVSVRKKDPIIDGVVIGAVAMLACLEWLGCNQGFSGQHNGRDWAVGLGVGMLLGGGFDASRQGTEVIYRRPAGAAARAIHPAFVLSIPF